jgi:hypothetical protein
MNEWSSGCLQSKIHNIAIKERQGDNRYAQEEVRLQAKAVNAVI